MPQDGLYAQLLVLHPLYGQYRAFPNDNTLRRSSGQASAGSFGFCVLIFVMN
ncbi:MAG: hypothetical protein ACKO90_34975 [Microcystis panniformis]